MWSSRMMYASLGKPQNSMNNCALIVFNLLSRKSNLKLNALVIGLQVNG